MIESILDEQNHEQGILTQETNVLVEPTVKSEPIIDSKSIDEPIIEEPTIIESEPIVIESKIVEQDKIESPPSEPNIGKLVIVDPIIYEISADTTEPEYVELDENTLETSTIPIVDSEVPSVDETEFFQKENSIDWETLNARSEDQISEMSQPNIDTDLLNIISELNKTTVGRGQTDRNNIEQVDVDSE